MRETIKRMMSRYPLETAEAAENALREILQEMALFALWKTDFFLTAAFYGGTALRILHGLPRYSEDMDFTLLQPEETFSLIPFQEAIEEELRHFGFQVQFQPRKRKSENGIASAFLKAATLEQMLVTEIPTDLSAAIYPGKKIRIKIEVDTLPPAGFQTELKPLLDPIPFQPRVGTLPSLFAGKMHAVLCRHWNNRVKGRDWYDLVWYLQRRTPLDLGHLEARMRQSGHWNEETTLSEEAFLRLYRETAANLDINAAIRDVAPFLKNPEDLAMTWSSPFFQDLTTFFRFL